MNKSEYALALLDSRWNKKRVQVLKRDNYRCTNCGADNCRLSVHHEIYLKDKQPWEVPMRYLKSMCDRCHSDAHKDRLIGSFVKDRLPVHKRARKEEKIKMSPQEEKMLVAKLVILTRTNPTSKKWMGYEKKLFEHKTLAQKDVAMINRWFNKLKKK